MRAWPRWRCDASGAFTLQIAPEAAPTVTLRFAIPHGKPIDVTTPIDVRAGNVESVELTTE